MSRSGPCRTSLRAVGLTLAFHRYYAHRAFQMNRVARFVWTFLGVAAMQKGPLWWAGHHVYHHKFADRDGDPHSPMVSGFYYAHIGWFLNDQKYKKIEPSNPGRPRLLEVPGDPAARRVLLPAAAAARPGDVRDRRVAVAGLGLLPADDDAGARHVRDQHGQPPVRIAPLRDARRVPQQRRSPRSSRRAKAGTTTTTATSAPRATGSTGGSSISPTT